MLWSHFPGLTLLELINQYHLFLAEQPFPTSHPNCKIGLQRLLCFGVKERSKITYQTYPGIYTICTSVAAAFYHLPLKIQSPVREFHSHSQEF